MVLVIYKNDIGEKTNGSSSEIFDAETTCYTLLAEVSEVPVQTSVQILSDTNVELNVLNSACREDVTMV